MVATLDRSLRNFFPHMDACRAAGCRVDVACRISEFEDEMRKHCDRLFDVPFRRSPVHPLNLVTLIKLVGIIKSHKYDIVHAHTPAGGMVGRAAATIAGTPIRVYTAHGFHFHPEGKAVSNFIFINLERFAGIFLSDWVEVINTEDYESAIAYGVATEQKLVMLDGTGIETEKFNPSNVSDAERQAVRRELGLNENTKVIGVIAELIPRKRLQDTLAATMILTQEFPDIQLVILGSGEQREGLEAMAVELGIENNVKFLGFRRDLARFIAVMDVFAFSTQQEGLPAALLEAMCMNVPAVATDIRGNRDIIVNGENGFLVPLGDANLMAEACRKLLTNPQLASELGAKGRQLVISKYDTLLTVAQQMAAYGKAMKAARSKGTLRQGVAAVAEWNFD
jgi:glycosyltransferase involved in cell wall biosynthesis